MAALVCVSGLGQEAIAEPIYGTAADLTGSREEGSGIITGGDYLTDGTTFTVSWVIEPPGDIEALDAESLFTYTYSFSGFARPDISHFILDLTDDCVGEDGDAADPACVTESSVEELEFREFSPDDPGGSNPGMPASIIGVKFDDLPDGILQISFLSNRAPVWGDFYLNGGNDSFAYDNGLANPTSGSVLDFIARPNGATTSAVPEPASLILLGGGLLGLAAWRRRSR